MEMGFQHRRRQDHQAGVEADDDTLCAADVESDQSSALNQILGVLKLCLQDTEVAGSTHRAPKGNA